MMEDVRVDSGALTLGHSTGTPRRVRGGGSESGNWRPPGVTAICQTAGYRDAATARVQRVCTRCVIVGPGLFAHRMHQKQASIPV